MAILKQLIELIYPLRCHICSEFIEDEQKLYESSASVICSSCMKSLPTIGSPRCTICSLPLPDSAHEDHLCE